ncbi:MAG: regulatory protein RecX [bacterium]|nr:regulatory protein RecX [bacterium]
MPVISKIVPQKRNKAYFSVYVDEQFAFSLSQKDLQYLQLRADTSLSDEELQKLIHTYSLQKAKDYAYRLVAGKTYSENELYAKLVSRFPEKTAHQVLDNLKQYGYIDDAKIIHEYARTKLNLKPMGKLKLKHILRNKKFKKELISPALEKIYAEYDEPEMARKLLRKHFKEKKKDLNKIKNYLLGNGFTYDLIHEIISEIRD